MGLCLSSNDEDIISEKSLDAVQELVSTLQRNVQEMGNGWIFRVGAAVHQETVNEFISAIDRGSIQTIQRLMSAGWRFEAAQALYMYLANLNQPLLPQEIQALVLDDNSNVPPEIVATDVLGLIKQDVPPRHLRLLKILLRLLDNIIRFSPSDELRGTTLPLSMIPLFFDIQLSHIRDWRRIATIFVEVIRQAGDILEIPRTHTVLNVPIDVALSEAFPSDDDLLYLLPHRYVVRRYVQPVGYRGDCKSIEVYRPS